MTQYSCYEGADWKFDIEAPNEREALARAKAYDPAVDRVEVRGRRAS